MINYELVKELRDAGFPQQVPQNNAYINGKFVYYPYSLSAKDEIVIIPTLSELMGACGNKFDSLCRAENYIEGRGFLAKTPIECAGFHNPDKESPAWCEFGITPEEAVAKLWIALNQK